LFRISSETYRRTSMLATFSEAMYIFYRTEIADEIWVK
jgi:hypothetical protein